MPVSVRNIGDYHNILLSAQRDVQEKFVAMGTEVVGSTPEELSQAMKSEMTRLGKLFKAGGIHQ